LSFFGSKDIFFTSRTTKGLASENSCLMDLIWGSEHQFFQKLVNHIWNFNTIFELNHSKRNKVHGFQDLVALTIDHFNNLFKEPLKANMAKILKQLSLFPHLIEEEDN
jgi:hypothetical protein